MSSPTLFHRTTDLSPVAQQHRLDLVKERTEELQDQKHRFLGADVETLNKQVAEKQRIKAYEKQREALYNNQVVELDQQCLLKEAEIQRKRFEIAKGVAQFRKDNQGKERTREWDLNDPRRVTRDVPTRIGDNDPRCGPASIQQFDGEDLVARERRKLQAEQMALWMKQQVDEKDGRKWAEKEANRLADERAEEALLKAVELERTVLARRKQLNLETASFNRTLSQVKKEQTIRDKFREQECNMREIQNALDSDLLTENLEASLNATDSNRFKPDGMKKFLPQQTQAILDEQARQREELAQRREAQKAEDRMWATQQRQLWRAATLLDRAEERARVARLQQINREHTLQREEQMQQQAHEDKLYSSAVMPSFHKRFGSSLR